MTPSVAQRIASFCSLGMSAMPSVANRRQEDDQLRGAKPAVIVSIPVAVICRLSSLVGCAGLSGLTQRASVGLQKKLISTKMAIAPMTMNITYWRMRPVCTARRLSAQRIGPAGEQVDKAIDDRAGRRRSPRLREPDASTRARPSKKPSIHALVERRRSAARRPCVGCTNSDVVQLVEPPLVDEQAIDRRELPADVVGVERAPPEERGGEQNAAGPGAGGQQRRRDDDRGELRGFVGQMLVRPGPLGPLAGGVAQRARRPGLLEQRLRGSGRRAGCRRCLG